MSEPEIAPRAAADAAADAAVAADADDTTLATTAVNSEGDDFATHVEKLIHSKKTETPSLLLDLRASLATPSDRLEGAEKMKLEANASLSAGTAELALRSYLTALWLLRLDDPPLPAALGAQQLPSGASLLPALGAGADAAGEGTSDAAPAVAAARATLRLNLAQCALKLGDWPLARAACELVLEREPANAKALYRLARAHEGTGELGDAIRVLSGRLLAAEPSHAEARRLLSALRERSKRERAMFGGVFDRAAASGGAADDEKGLYSEAALRAQEEARRAELDRLMKVENLAKLPPDQWAHHVGGLGDAKREQLLEETRELSRDMPDGAWQKHVANMGPEAVEQARAARRLIDAQREAKEARQALLGDDAEGEGEDEESDFFFDRWIDSLGAKGLLGVLAAVGLGAALVPMVVAAMAAA